MEKWDSYYYNRMTRDAQTIYHAMLAGFRSLAAEIRVPCLPKAELGEIFFQLRLDHPEIFYVTGCGCRWSRDAEHMELLPEYMFDRPHIREHQKALQARLEKLVRPALARGDEEKERYIHDFLCENVRYDKLKKSYSHEIIGPLQNGVGVCEGIAKTVKLMCDRLGLPCLIAVSEADPQLPGGYLHAWNIVALNGRQYHLDVTFDNTLSRGGIRYDYFNLDDSRIFRDHRPLRSPMPACTDADGFYYKKARLSLTKPEDCARRVTQAIRKRKETFVFHWRGGCLTRQTLLELSEVIGPAAAGQGRGVHYSVNWPQAVIRLDFTEPGAAHGIETENADEAGGAEL